MSKVFWTYAAVYLIKIVKELDLNSIQLRADFIEAVYNPRFLVNLCTRRYRLRFKKLLFNPLTVQLFIIVETNAVISPGGFKFKSLIVT